MGLKAFDPRGFAQRKEPFDDRHGVRPDVERAERGGDERQGRFVRRLLPFGIEIDPHLDVAGDFLARL